MTVIIVMPSDEEVICDLCNGEIGTEEGGSFVGSYSLCVECTKRVFAGASAQEKKDMIIFEKDFRAEVIKKRIKDAEESWENT
jgi:hypothetical protein